MTRDEARIKYKLQFERDISIALKVVRSFEARTCRNCKYCDTRDTPMVCMQMDVPTSYADIPDEKYGCTRWEVRR